MKLGVIGLSGSGKTTVFEALTGHMLGPEHKGEDRIGSIQVPDHRVDVLSGMYKPQKTTYAKVEYLLEGSVRVLKDTAKGQAFGAKTKDCDALIHVIRNFRQGGFEKPEPQADFFKLEQELILADLMVVEKRKQRLELDKKRGDKTVEDELALLCECLDVLENETPLRNHSEISTAPLLKGYSLLSAKPMLLLFNNEDDDESLPESEKFTPFKYGMIIRGKLEHELAQMTPEEAASFLAEFNISASATDRVIKQSYALLGLISFFTVSDKEVRVSTIKKGTTVLDAAGVVHTDMKRGFIRAEVISFDDLMTAGGFQEAKKKGSVRLEGKSYEVQDGDIIYIRFNV